ncbi:MAG: PQQ-binding-like beta-propeller repeat protein [Bacteroidetes bacterium]|nr:PQQ-binding-like beta-propeller repeat protein [Bacteroidota bacterium]
MLKRWMAKFAVCSAFCFLFSACVKKNYSSDTPLADTYSSTLFIGSQAQRFYALDPVTGVEKWEYNLKKDIQATSIVIGDFLFVPALDTLYKFDVNTGKKLYAFDASQYTNFISSPVSDGKSLFIACTAGTDTRLLKINPSNNAIVWNVLLSSSSAISASLAIYNNVIYAVLNNGSLQGYNAGNGTPVWGAPLVPPTVPSNLTPDPIISSPCVSYPYIYVGSPNDSLYAYRISDGTLAWTFGATNPILSSPIVYGGNVIFGSNDNWVYCVDSIAKTARWKFKTADRVISSAVAYGQIVFIGGYDSYFYALHILNGDLKWRYKTGALIYSTPLSVNGDVYVAGYDKYLYKFDTSGTLKWKYNVNGLVETSPVLQDFTAKKSYYPSISGMYPY